jgi:hypothetical protein
MESSKSLRINKGVKKIGTYLGSRIFGITPEKEIDVKRREWNPEKFIAQSEFINTQAPHVARFRIKKS